MLQPFAVRTGEGDLFELVGIDPIMMGREVLLGGDLQEVEVFFDALVGNPAGFNREGFGGGSRKLK